MGNRGRLKDEQTGFIRSFGASATASCAIGFIAAMLGGVAFAGAWFGLE